MSDKPNYREAKCCFSCEHSTVVSDGDLTCAQHKGYIDDHCICDSYTGDAE